MMNGVCSSALTTSALNSLLMGGGLCLSFLYASTATRPPIGQDDTVRTLIGRDDGGEWAGGPAELSLNPAVLSTAQ